jgi:nucleoside-diphosphate-sugar epimerase
MRILITGSSGHLGEALVRVLRTSGHEVVGLDLLPSAWTDVVASITDVDAVHDCMQGVDAVIHTATLHKPHIETHDKQAFIEVNVRGTLVLLEQAVAAGAGRFVYTSTTSSFGRALAPAADQPAAWITEAIRARPKNIYGTTKVAAEDLCELISFETGLPCVVLRTSRFFPEPDDQDQVRAEFDNTNLKVNELLNRRVDLEDAVQAHILAIERAPDLGFDRFIISATTPFSQADLPELRRDAPAVVRRYYPNLDEVYRLRNWSMFPSLDRVYVNERARTALRWDPRYSFGRALQDLASGRPVLSSELAVAVGSKGYHANPTGVYTRK